ncbi:MAG: flagellar FliJ family protein [Planctomycetes bacterium]|nr:flagellar FliJ family protein [Planctomycetota bacterium]
MKPFRFAFDPILEYRSRVEEARRLEFALAQSGVLAQSGKLYGYLTEEKARLEELRRARGKEVDVARIRAQEERMVALARRVSEAREDLSRAILREREQAERLRLASQERRAMERLRELRSTAYAETVSREEQRLVDEMASNLCRSRPDANPAPAAGAEARVP